MPTKAQRAKMTEEQKQRERENNREYKRRQSANMTEEEKQQRRDKKRKWIANRTEEQKQRAQENARKWRANMTEEQKQHERDKEHMRRANWTEEQKQHKAGYQRKWRANMPEEQKQRYDAQKRNMRANMTEEQKEITFRKAVLSGVKRRAEKRDPPLPCNITFQYLNVIWPLDNKCPVFGTPFERGKGQPINTSPNVDRIEPELGYVIGNVQILSHLANKIKNDATPAQVLAVGQYLVEQERERE